MWSPGQRCISEKKRSFCFAYWIANCTAKAVNNVFDTQFTYGAAVARAPG